MLLAELEVLIIIKVEDLLLKVSISLGSVRVEAVFPTSSKICLVRQAGAVVVRVAKVELNYLIGFWIILILMLALIAMSVIQFLGLKGNKVFDAVNSAEDENGTAGVSLPSINADGIKSAIGSVNADSIKNMAQSAAGSIAGAAGNLKDKASQAAANMQNHSSTASAKKEDPKAIMEQIKQLHEMKENGILTEEEFAEKKKEFLERL